MFDQTVRDFLLIWTTVDPIGALAIFAALTASKDYAERRRIARKSVVYAFIILFVSIIAGQIILTGMGIKLIALEIAGGIILLIFGLKMIFENILATDWGAETNGNHDMAVFPLAVPVIAAPGSIMAVIMLTDNNAFSLPQQAITTGMMAIVLSITYLMMICSDHILKVIGQNGAAILVKVMGMILAAFSVELIMDALELERWFQGVGM
ncbi:MAG: methyltransferase, CheR-type [Rickettsiales bacterium]|jgi:multiple antibiotic resistance protein|nr:methyltransferase, CheR-type [Rickettsiales bacterium]